MVGADRGAGRGSSVTLVGSAMSEAAANWQTGQSVCLCCAGPPLSVGSVEQMVEWAKGKDPLHVSIYGEGLMQAMVAQALNSGNYERYLREQAMADMRGVA